MKSYKRYRSALLTGKNTLSHVTTTPYHIAEVKKGNIVITDMQLRTVHMKDKCYDLDDFAEVDIFDDFVQQETWTDMGLVVRGLCMDDLLYKIKQTPEYWAFNFVSKNNIK